VAQREVGRQRLVRLAPRAQDLDPVALLRQLVDEPRLTDARLADDGDQPAMPAAG
jgi:7,8-dihydro-6-hydroxymethylpterin-pyrophosphokinase